MRLQIVQTVHAKDQAAQRKTRAKLDKVQRYRRWIFATRSLNHLERERDKDDIDVWPDANDLRRMPGLQSVLNGHRQSTPAPTTVHAPGDDMDVTSDDTSSERSGPSRDESFRPVSSSQSDPSLCEGDDGNQKHDAPRRHHAHKGRNDSCAWCDAQRRDVEEAMKAHFPSAVEAWRQSITEELFAHIPSDVNEAPLVTYSEKLSFLSRATTVFRCEGWHEINDSWGVCGAVEPTGSGLLHYPYALQHTPSCALEPLDRFEHFEDGTNFGASDPQAELRIDWSAEYLELDQDAATGIAELVKQSGLDQKRATQHDMDAADPRFVCRSCLDEGLPTDKVAVVGWRSPVRIMSF